MVQKFYAIKNQKVISTATVVGTIFCLIIGGAAYLVGSTTTLYGSRIVALEANANYFADSPDYAAAVTDPAVARQLIGSALKTKGSYANTNLIPQIMQITMPNGLLIIILLLVLSASMSTLSSLVLVSSSAITIDLLQGHFAPKMSKERGMSIMRLLCAAFIALSLLVASLSRKWPHLVALMSFSWGTVAGAFLAPYLYGLFWKGVTKVGAWAGLIAGLALHGNLYLVCTGSGPVCRSYLCCAAGGFISHANSVGGGSRGELADAQVLPGPFGPGLWLGARCGRRFGGCLNNIQR